VVDDTTARGSRFGATGALSQGILAVLTGMSSRSGTPAPRRLEAVRETEPYATSSSFMLARVDAHQVQTTLAGDSYDGRVLGDDPPLCFYNNSSAVSLSLASWSSRF